MSIIDRLVSVIAPHECLCCQSEGSVLCENCANTLPWIPSRCYRCHALTSGYATCAKCRRRSPLKAVAVATTYNDTAKAAVKKYKFERAQATAHDLARTMGMRHTDFLQDAIIVPVPTASSRVRLRGYDHAALLAKALSGQQHGIAVYAPLLNRFGQHKQVGSSAKLRRLQMQDAFRVARKADHLLRHRKIILVDDVLTTGATLEAAALALRRAGAKHIEAIVFAEA